MTPESIKSLALKLEGQKQASTETGIKKEILDKCLAEQFPDKRPSGHLVNALFERFKPLQVKEDEDGIAQGEQMDIVDFLLGCNLLSRVTQDKKIKLMFQLCDHDQDGCMNPVHIL